MFVSLHFFPFTIKGCEFVFLNIIILTPSHALLKNVQNDRDIRENKLLPAFRGNKSLDVIKYMFCLKIRYPDNVRCNFANIEL